MRYAIAAVYVHFPIPNRLKIFNIFLPKFSISVISATISCTFFPILPIWHAIIVHILRRKQMGKLWRNLGFPCVLPCFAAYSTVIRRFFMGNSLLCTGSRLICNRFYRAVRIMFCQWQTVSNSFFSTHVQIPVSNIHCSRNSVASAFAARRF